jgi:hypothetical protein
MSLRRGFKSEANATAVEVRGELGLPPTAALDPFVLAEYLTIPVRPISDLQSREPAGVGYLLAAGRESFSAVTVFNDHGRTIWHNDAHAPARQVSNVAHEVAHALLLHPPGLIDGTRDWNATQEEEAAWLGGALLVTDEAAAEVARRGLPIEVAAEFYGVSERLMTWRVNVSGAVIRAERAAAKSGRR